MVATVCNRNKKNTPRIQDKRTQGNVINALAVPFCFLLNNSTYVIYGSMATNSMHLFLHVQRGDIYYTCGCPRVSLASFFR